MSYEEDVYKVYRNLDGEFYLARDWRGPDEDGAYFRSCKPLQHLFDNWTQTFEDHRIKITIEVLEEQDNVPDWVLESHYNLAYQPEVEQICQAK